MNLSKRFTFTISASFIWAVSIIITRHVLKGGEDAYNLLFWTTVLASPYWIYILLKNKKEAVKISQKSMIVLLGIGLISTVAVSLTEMLALKYTSAINFTFLNRSVIFFTMLFAAIFLQERITGKKLILALLIIVGAYLLITNGQSISFAIGDVFTLIEAALIAFGNNVLGKMAVKLMSRDLSASGSFIIGIIPIAILCSLLSTITLPASIHWVIILTILTIIFTLLRFQAYNYAPASYISMIFSATPVFVAVMACSFLSETILPLQTIGASMIIGAGLLTEKLKEK